MLSWIMFWLYNEFWAEFKKIRAPTKRLGDLEGKEKKGKPKCHKERCEYFGFFVYLTFIPSKDLWVQVNRNKLGIEGLKTRFFSFLKWGYHVFGFAVTK